MRLQPAFLSRQQVELVHRNALRVLAEVGVKVENEELRRRLTSVGGRADSGGDVVRFAAAEAERYIAAAPKTPSSDAPGRVGARVGVYQSRYLEPQDDRLVRFDETRLAKYAAMARELGYVERIGMLGVPFEMPDIPPAYQPLAEKEFDNRRHRQLAALQGVK